MVRPSSPTRSVIARLLRVTGHAYVRRHLSPLAGMLRTKPLTNTLKVKDLSFVEVTCHPERSEREKGSQSRNYLPLIATTFASTSIESQEITYRPGR